MNIELAAFHRTTLPLDMQGLNDIDSSGYSTVWLPDHMVSFWPDSIWTPEFTDLATVSPSPHRHLDGLAVAAAVAVATSKVSIATCVVDTVRRHPSLLAQTALTIDHLSEGRFVLGLGSGETENTVPYGFDFSKPVSRFEEALQVIRLLWESEGPVNFDGRFYQVEHARLDTEPFAGKFPEIWVGASGPRMLDITGRYADGWWPTGIYSPEDYEEKLQTVRESAEQADRDPQSIKPALILPCLIGDEQELADFLEAPLIKAYALQIPAEVMKLHGYDHPMGPDWRGIQDINPGALNREKIISALAKVNGESILAALTHGTPREIARIVKQYADAGMGVVKILDYGGMAGLAYSARSAGKVAEAEWELLRLTRGV